MARSSIKNCLEMPVAPVGYVLHKSPAFVQRLEDADKQV